MPKNNYQEEFEKYKHIKILPGFYILKNTEHIKYEVLEVFEEENKVSLKTIKTENIQTKTLHWCRKNLVGDNLNDEPTDSLTE